MLAAYYSKDTLFLSQADILENTTVAKFSLRVHGLLSKTVNWTCGDEGSSKCKAASQHTQSQEIFLSKKITAHFYSGQWHITKSTVEQN